jgi:TonB-linked SusC/RagA family outer membrane protein
MRLIIQKVGCVGLLPIVFAVLSGTELLAQEGRDSVAQQEEYQPIGYGIQPKWMVSSAVSGTTGEQLSKTFATNLGNTLYGRIPGLTVMQAGAEPGEDSPVLYGRGVNTFGPDKGLLIMVDGVEAPFERWVPDEIESIVLLKDAAATAIYGSRGANGVLLVTTKRGFEGPLEVSLSTQQGFQSALRLPEFLGSYDYAVLYNEALVNDGQEPFYSAEALAAYQNGSDPYFYPDVNWYDEILRKSAPVSNYNLNFRGGSNGIRYFASLNALKNNGLYKKTGSLSDNSDNASYNRYNLRLNLDIDISRRLAMGLNIAGAIENKSTPGGNNTSAIFEKMATIPPNAFPVRNPDGSYGGTSIYTNPLADILESGYYTSNAKTFQATVNLTEQLDFIAPGLSLSGLISFNNYSQSFFNKVRQYARYAISHGPSGEVVYNQIGQNTSLTGEAGQGSQWRNYTLQSFLNYVKDFGSSTLNGMLMFNADNYSQSGVNQNFEHVGAGGRFTFTNRQKYIGEFSFGYYGSENFPEGERFGFFPAVSLGWIVSNEGFLKDSNLISFLKLRTSYGLTGHDNIGGQRFMFYQEYISGAGYFFGTGNNSFGGIAEGVLANPDVTWEKDEKFNVGLEATLLDRLSVSFDYFKNHRYDILAKPFNHIPQFMGLSMMPDLNVGKLNNHGFEAVLRYESNDQQTLQYFIEGSAWYARNKIADKSEALLAYDYLNETGNAVGQPIMLEAIGFFRDQAEIDASPRQIFTTVRPGDIKYKDQNGDGIVDQNDYYPVGRPEVPELTFALHGGMKFRSFDFDFLLQGVDNRSVYLQGNYFYAFQNNARISAFALNRWTPATAETADYPRLSAENNLNNFQPSSFWLRDGSFIKLRSVEIGYSFPAGTLDKLNLKSLRVFLNGTNLFSIDEIDFTDPETLTGYPAYRTVSAGVSLKL